jgi:hypothetical protein
MWLVKELCKQLKGFEIPTETSLQGGVSVLGLVVIAYCTSYLLSTTGGLTYARHLGYM